MCCCISGNKEKAKAVVNLLAIKTCGTNSQAIAIE